MRWYTSCYAPKRGCTGVALGLTCPELWCPRTAPAIYTPSAPASPSAIFSAHSSAKSPETARKTTSQARAESSENSSILRSPAHGVGRHSVSQEHGTRIGTPGWGAERPRVYIGRARCMLCCELPHGPNGVFVSLQCVCVHTVCMAVCMAVYSPNGVFMSLPAERADAKSLSSDTGKPRLPEIV